MRLTKDQRAYVSNKLSRILREKTEKFQGVYFGAIRKEERFPAKVNKAIDTLMQFQESHNKEVKEKQLPFTKRKAELEEELLFADNLSSVQALLDSFQEFTG